jgi:hypothetical protein
MAHESFFDLRRDCHWQKLPDATGPRGGAVPRLQLIQIVLKFLEDFSEPRDRSDVAVACSGNTEP